MAATQNPRRCISWADLADYQLDKLPATSTLCRKAAFSLPQLFLILDTPDADGEAYQ
jgi:hypothetical protein